ncbi:hypothetical protein AC1031_006888 [Aphanomyces cochlioides]|nr:hypothetical protein AC1031_006888 [Aphanomyces cochlioides]
MDPLWLDDGETKREDRRKKRKIDEIVASNESQSMWKYFRSLIPQLVKPLVHATTSAGCLDALWVDDHTHKEEKKQDVVALVPRPIKRARKQPTHIRGETVQIGFGGCGGFYNYLLGVASIVQEHFDLTNAVFSGASAGCFPALVLAMEKNVVDFFHDANLTLIRDADKKSFMGLQKWIPLTREHTLRQLEPDTYLKLDKKFYCSITRVPSLENELVTSWKNNEDMVDCMLTSGHVPLYHPELLKTFRDNKYIDGSVSNNDPAPLGSLAPSHVFHFWKWRNILPHWVLVSTDANWANQQFEWGRADALAHIEDIEAILHYKED